MDSKSYAVIAIALVAGLVGGYLASSIPSQSHVSDLEDQITELNEQLKVRVRIEKISWPPNSVKVEVRNTGSATARARLATLVLIRHFPPIRQDHECERETSRVVSDPERNRGIDLMELVSYYIFTL